MRRLVRTTLCIAAIIGCWAGAMTLGDHARAERKTWPPAEAHALFLPPPEIAPTIFAGYRQLMADITWVRALVYYGSSMLGEADYRYLERFIDNVIALDPRFKRVYRWATYAVTYKHETATAEEFEVAVRYAEQGIEMFPDTYEFYWIAGLRYFLDMHSDNPDERRRIREHGAELIEKAMHKPDAPKNLVSVAANLRMKLGQKERALADLRSVILTTDNEEAQQKLIARYNSIASTAFPDEAKQAKADFERRWKDTLPFASPSLYVLMGERPSPVIDFDELATDRDIFAAEPDDLFGPEESDAPEPAATAGQDDAQDNAQGDAGADASDAADAGGPPAEPTRPAAAAP